MLQTGNSKRPEYSRRLSELPPYLFVEVDRMKAKALADNVDIINLGVGDPDIPTPVIIRNRMKEAIDDPQNHQYPMGKGKASLRIKISEFMKKRFGLELDPDKQIHPLLGSKEGIAHLPLAFINPGDTAIVPEPAYPVYNSGTVFAGGTPYYIPLRKENGFLPDWSDVPADVLNRARLLYINYPNNPTGAVADEGFFSDTVRIARKYGIIIAHDAAYSEMYYGNTPLSFLQTEGAMDISIEFHSLSKTFSMTGWRLGWAAGDSSLVKGLASIKDNIDSGVFGAVQDAGIAALDNYDELSSEVRSVYGERARVMSEGLLEMGWDLEIPEATFYIWARPPIEVSSADAVKKIISEAGIVCTPGSGFGPSGEGYVRFALTRGVERIREALGRLKEIQW